MTDRRSEVIGTKRAERLRSYCSAHRRSAVLAMVILVAMTPVVVRLLGPAAAVNRTLKIGFKNSAPYHFPDANGNPSGPAVNLVQEAAQRKNIHLQWVFSPQGPEAALSSGDVDLWPIIGD